MANSRGRFHCQFRVAAQNRHGSVSRRRQRCQWNASRAERAAGRRVLTHSDPPCGASWPGRGGRAVRGEMHTGGRSPGPGDHRPGPGLRRSGGEAIAVRRGGRPAPGGSAVLLPTVSASAGCRARTRRRCRWCPGRSPAVCCRSRRCRPGAPGARRRRPPGWPGGRHCRFYLTPPIPGGRRCRGGHRGHLVVEVGLADLTFDVGRLVVQVDVAADRAGRRGHRASRDIRVGGVAASGEPEGADHGRRGDPRQCSVGPEMCHFPCPPSCRIASIRHVDHAPAGGTSPPRPAHIGGDVGQRRTTHVTPGAAGRGDAQAPSRPVATLSPTSSAALRDVQDAAGHRDPRTTRRYDHARGQHARPPPPTAPIVRRDQAAGRVDGLLGRRTGAGRDRNVEAADECRRTRPRHLCDRCLRTTPRRSRGRPVGRGRSGRS